MDHKFVEWPDEEAKKYFYDKPIDRIPNEFEVYGRYCGVFRDVKDYDEKNSREIKKEQEISSMTPDERRDMENQKKKDDA